MTQALVVTGTDTGVGKTVFAAALTGAIGARYWKPVQAGLDDDGHSDSDRVRDLSGISHARIVPEAYRLTTPCSPHRAAAIDGVRIDPERLGLPDGHAPLVIEGAGGVSVPLSDSHLFIDQFALWNLPVVVVARTAIGTINHSLLTIGALKARNIAIHGIAFVGDAQPDSEDTIARIGGVRRLGRLPLLQTLDAAALRSAFDAGFARGDFA